MTQPISGTVMELARYLRNYRLLLIPDDWLILDFEDKMREHEAVMKAVEKSRLVERIDTGGGRCPNLSVKQSRLATV